MKEMKEILAATTEFNYGRHFWNAMVLDRYSETYIQNALGTESTMYMPCGANTELRKKKAEYGVIRNLASNFSIFDSTSTIWAYDSDNNMRFVGETEQIPVDDADKDFSKIRVQRHKATGITKVPSTFLSDSHFDVEEYLIDRIAEHLAQIEDKAFINGTGTKEPTGLLHAENGAQTSSVIESIGYDDCINIFFSVKPEYRKNAVWLMNDNTALALRKLKDADGNYLWNQANDKILGKHVHICNDMPDAEPGKKPVLFGDMSYYWIIDRSPVGIKPLRELYAAEGKVGYLVQEFLDARLVRPEAVKSIEIKSEKDNG